MIIGEAPGEREDDSGVPFVGRSGRLLDDCLEAAGVSRERVYITNAVHCRPPLNRTPKAKEVKSCSYWLDQEIEAVQPKYVLILGATALYGSLGLKGLKSFRGTVIEKAGISYKVTYHPAYALRNEKSLPILQEDIIQFFKLARQEKAQYITYELIKGEESIQRTIKWIESSDEIAIDCETSNLDPYDPNSKIVSFGMSDGVTQKILVLNHQEYTMSKIMAQIIMKRLGKALSKVKIIGHNIKFDITFIHQKYGFLLNAHFDTMLALHIVDENKSLGLKNSLSRIFPKFVDYDIPTTQKQGNGSLDAHCKYLAKDCYYTYHLRQYLIKSGEMDHVNKLSYHLVRPVSNLYTKAEIHGVYIDPIKYDEAFNEWQRKVSLYERELNQIKKINWNSPKQIGQLLFEDLNYPVLHKTNKGAASTAEQTLLELNQVLKQDTDDSTVIDWLLNYRGALKNLQFLKSWDDLKDSNGFIHPKFKIHGTVTGRPSCEEPNLQQTPREGSIRQCIGAPRGYVLVEIDYSQIELRLVADAADEREMKKCFLNNVDIHTETARWVLGIQDITSEFRKKAKAVNFGFIYGMDAPHFREYAFLKFGVDFTLEECEDMKRKYFKRYRALIPWHKYQKKLARAYGYVSTWTGRRRNLPAALSNDYNFEMGEALRQSINAPIQGGAAELTLAAAVEINETFPEIPIVGTVHDALLFYLREKDIDKYIPDIYSIMIEPKLLKVFNKKFSVPIDVEVKIGNWGSGKIYQIAHD